MPKGDDRGMMWGFQLWVDLPASHKMMEPRYRDVKSNDIPEVELETGVRVKIICGRVAGKTGPVRDIVIDPGCFRVSDFWLYSTYSRLSEAAALQAIEPSLIFCNSAPC
jgi:redox-sensitive bicupin YhaK (pirin superfamily)